MDYYHGTTIPGLRELHPHASPYSNLNEPVVYLTTSKQLALHYIWDTQKLAIKMPMLKIRDDGVLVFQEMFSGALKYFYKGVSGYIYHCVGEYAVDEATEVATCATSLVPVPITDSEYIEDVYVKIQEYEQQGRFIYECYESLPPYRHDIIRGHVMRRIQHDNLLHNEIHPCYRFFQEKFPQYWKEAVVLHQHKLL